MSSKAEICNLALLSLSGLPITSLTDGTATADACLTVYETVAEDVMSAGAWTRCTIRTGLAQTANTPAYKYTYEYQLPTSPKVLKVLAVNEAANGAIDYVIEGDKLLTDESTIDIKYIGKIEDPNAYGPFLRKAIVAGLAAELAMHVTGQVQAAERAMEKYRIALAEGLANDGQQGSMQVVTTSDYIIVR